MTKLYYFVFIGIIILAGIGIYFYLSQEPAQILPKEEQEQNLTTATTTTALKTYRNEEWGFEFEYPEDWEVKENTFGSYYSKFNLVINPILVRSSNFTISINIVLPEFPERSFKNIEKTISEIVVGGVSGIKYQYEFGGLQETAIILPLREYKIILGTDDEQYTEIFNQVIASFKFLK